MPPRYQVKPPPPVVRLRDVARLLMLVILAALMIGTLFKAADPRTWQWVKAYGRQPEGEQRPGDDLEPTRPAPPSSFVHRLQCEQCGGQAVGFLAAFTTPSLAPASVDAALACPLHLEHVPLPEYVEWGFPATRRAPVPLPDILGGAYDRQRFLLDNPIVTRENPDDLLNDRKRQDADARYHLLELANGAAPEALAADAQRDVRYSALLEKPAAYRGEIIHIEGDLLWTVTFEFKNRTVPGLKHAYLGAMTVDSPERGYWILFTELPPDFPSEREWPKLYRHGVRFDGYFLKVLMIDHPRDQDKVLYVPVLVGKTVELPAVAADGGWGIPILPTVAIALGVILLVLLLGYVYRRSESAHAQRLLAVRQQARADVEGLESATDSIVDPPALPQRNGGRIDRFEDIGPPLNNDDETRFGSSGDTRSIP